MKFKGETITLLSNFIVYVINQFNFHIKTIKTDNEKEFNHDELYNKYGIGHQRSCI